MTKEQELCRQAANRLHHLSMVYVGALAELGQGKEITALPAGYPGLWKCRDFLDLFLMLRAEMNGITKLLMEKGIVTESELLTTFTEEYNYMADVKGKLFGVEVTDTGLVFRNNPEG